MRTRKTDEGQQSFVSIFFEWVGFSPPNWSHRMTERLSEFTPLREQIKALPFIIHINASLQKVAEKEIALTKTGNINLASIKKLSEVIPPPDFEIEYTIRSEDDWPYLMFIDAICKLAKLTQNRAGKKVLPKMGKGFLTSLPERQLLFELCFNFSVKLGFTQKPIFG